VLLGEDEGVAVLSCAEGEADGLADGVAVLSCVEGEVVEVAPALPAAAPLCDAPAAG
jgi:hypothetical protein